MPTCLFCVKSSNSDQNPIRHHKYQKRSGWGWLWDRAHTAELGLARGQLQTLSWYPVPGGLGEALADGAPAAERRITWLCGFCLRRRNATFSAAVVLDSLVVLGMGLFFNISANIRRKRRGMEGGRCSGLLSLYFMQALPGLKGCPTPTPTPGPVPQSADRPEVP